jgi:hypothetical protein
LVITSYGWITRHGKKKLGNKFNDLKLVNYPSQNKYFDIGSYLAGFIDADGHFYIRPTLNQILCKFSLEQRMIYPKTQQSYQFILEEIASFLGVQLNIRIRAN